MADQMCLCRALERECARTRVRPVHSVLAVQYISRQLGIKLMFFWLEMAVLGMLGAYMLGNATV